MRLEYRALAPAPGRKAAARALRQLMGLLNERFARGHERRVRHACRLAKHVESLHGAEIDCPKGLAAHLAMLGRSLTAHRRQEVLILSDAIGDRNRADTPSRLDTLRAEHEEIDQQLMRLAVLTRDFTPPMGADPSWRQLCQVCRDLDRDLREQMRLEGDVVYPCLDGSNDALWARPPVVLPHVAAGS
jgi:regulator of cell morphogenesis and NO signaling